MTYKEGIIPLLNAAMSRFSASISIKMRSGKVTSLDHVRFGIVSMLFNSLIEVNCSDDLFPLGRNGVRRLIHAFNRLTGEVVPDVWGEYCSTDQRLT